VAAKNISLLVCKVIFLDKDMFWISDSIAISEISVLLEFDRKN
jgi:hypothetical protein